MHLVPLSLRRALQGQRKVAADLKKIYTAVDRDHAESALERFATWDGKYPMISASWIENWERIVPFLAFPPDVRRAVYTTNTIEALNRQIRKIIKTRGKLPRRRLRPQAALPRDHARPTEMEAHLQLELSPHSLPNPLRRPHPRHCLTVTANSLSLIDPRKSNCYYHNSGLHRKRDALGKIAV